MASPSDPIEPTLLPEAAVEAAAHPERALKVVDLYKAAIGPRQQAYYLKQFARQEAGPGVRLGWHWPAFFSALNWLVFRKMWAWGFRYAALLGGLAIATFVAADALGLDRLQTLLLGAGAWLLASVLAGVLANALYYRHCMALIHRVLVNGSDREAAAEVLAEQASGNRRFSGQVLVNVALLLFLPALATFAPWSGRDTWDWLTESPAGAATSEAAAAEAPPVSDVDEGEKRVLPPGTATPTLKITAVEPPASPASENAPAPATASVAPVLPADQESPQGPVAPVSEARASARVGLVLPAEPAPPPVPVVAVPAASPAVSPAPTAPKRLAPAAGFGVQVGIFAQPANVANAIAQLKAQGLPVYTDPITMGGQPRTRVRVGPYGTREEAQRVARQIEDVGLPAVVVPLPAGGKRPVEPASGR